MTDPSMRGRLSRRALLGGAGALGVLAATGACSTSGGTNIRFFETKREVIKYFTQVTHDYNASQTKFHVALENSTKVVADFVRNTPVQVGVSNYALPFGSFVRRG